MNIQFRKGTLADTELLVQFLDMIKAGMSRQDWFYLDPPETVRQMMKDNSMVLWLAMDGERLAAVFTAVNPGMGSCNYGYDLGLSAEELLQVIHMDTAAVHPDYRGLGLQGRMVRMAEQELSGKGRRILLSTVHPENRFSLDNMLAQGYEVQKQVAKYGSDRLVLRKDIF